MSNFISKLIFPDKSEFVVRDPNAATATDLISAIANKVKMVWSSDHTLAHDGEGNIFKSSVVTCGYWTRTIGTTSVRYSFSKEGYDTAGMESTHYFMWLPSWTEAIKFYPSSGKYYLAGVLKATVASDIGKTPRDGDSLTSFVSGTATFSFTPQTCTIETSPSDSFERSSRVEGVFRRVEDETTYKADLSTSTPLYFKYTEETSGKTVTIVFDSNDAYGDWSGVKRTYSESGYGDYTKPVYRYSWADWDPLFVVDAVTLETVTANGNELHVGSETGPLLEDYGSPVIVRTAKGGELADKTYVTSVKEGIEKDVESVRTTATAATAATAVNASAIADINASRPDVVSIGTSGIGGDGNVYKTQYQWSSWSLYSADGSLYGSAILYEKDETTSISTWSPGVPVNPNLTVVYDPANGTLKATQVVDSVETTETFSVAKGVDVENGCGFVEDLTFAGRTLKFTRARFTKSQVDTLEVQSNKENGTSLDTESDSKYPTSKLVAKAIASAIASTVQNLWNSLKTGFISGDGEVYHATSVATGGFWTVTSDGALKDKAINFIERIVEDYPEGDERTVRYHWGDATTFDDSMVSLEIAQNCKISTGEFSSVIISMTDVDTFSFWNKDYSVTGEDNWAKNYLSTNFTVDNISVPDMSFSADEGEYALTMKYTPGGIGEAEKTGTVAVYDNDGVLPETVSKAMLGTFDTTKVTDAADNSVVKRLSSLDTSVAGKLDKTATAADSFKLGGTLAVQYVKTHDTGKSVYLNDLECKGYVLAGTTESPSGENRYIYIECDADTGNKPFLGVSLDGVTDYAIQVPVKNGTMALLEDIPEATKTKADAETETTETINSTTYLYSGLVHPTDGSKTDSGEDSFDLKIVKDASGNLKFYEGLEASDSWAECVADYTDQESSPNGSGYYAIISVNFPGGSDGTVHILTDTARAADMMLLDAYAGTTATPTSTTEDKTVETKYLSVSESFAAHTELAKKADLSYPMKTLTVGTDGYYHAEDRTVNIITAADSTSLVVCLPKPATENVRDLIVKIKVTAETAPSVTFQMENDGGSVDFEAESSDWATLEAGVNIFSFTETERG